MAMDDGVKQRLVGAIVLITLGLIFIPMLFEEKTKNSYVSGTQIPPKPAIDNIESIKNKNFSTNIEKAETAVDKQQQIWDEQDKQVVSEEASHSAEIKNGVTATDIPAVTITSNGLPESWTLQVGMFGDKKNANELYEQLMVMKFPSYIREIKSGNDTVFKVFVGPEVDKARALDLKQQLLARQQELHITGVMLKAYQP
jgi:DedD protein